MITWIILVVVVVAVLFLVFMYNNFVRKVNRAKEAWADIDVQLKRRYDLIPNLVNTVRGYATHESSAFEKVTQARAHKQCKQLVLQARVKQKICLQTHLKSVFAIAEAYPDLKANQNFLALQTELSDTENKVQAARRFYNSNVRDLNIAIESFPNNIIANVFKFTKMDLFELGSNDAAAREPVEVKF